MSEGVDFENDAPWLCLQQLLFCSGNFSHLVGEEICIMDASFTAFISFFPENSLYYM